MSDEVSRFNPNRCHHYIVGVSIGEAAEPTACAVVEQRTIKVAGWGSECEFIALRQLERMPFGTSHTDLVAYLRQKLMPSLDKMDQAGGAELVVDVNATGRAVAELMAKQGLKPIKVSITAAAGEARDSADFNEWRVGRPDMVGLLQLAMQSKRFDAAKGLDLLPVLGSELQNFKLRAPSIRETELSALRDTKHADLVFAVGLAVWRAEREIPIPRWEQREWDRKFNDPARFKHVV
ncbi:MAG TPA: hypothetical protein VMU06_13025 [Stellaceae bacterium]|nr:hypothetical protein [Stellaceae bacterium]